MESGGCAASGGAGGRVPAEGLGEGEAPPPEAFCVSVFVNTKVSVKISA